jgi:hypothetical protein
MEARPTGLDLLLKDLEERWWRMLRRSRTHAKKRRSESDGRANHGTAHREKPPAEGLVAGT